MRFLAVDEELAARLLMKAGEDLDQRRLARAVVAEHAENLALSERQRHAVERGDRAETLDDIFAAQRASAGTASDIRALPCARDGPHGC